MRWLASCAFVLLVASVHAAEPVRVVSWNLESGGAEIDSIAEQVSRMQGVDLWGFCEVSRSWVDDLRNAARVGERGTFRAIAGTTGGDDLLVIVYDEEQLELVSSFEMHWNGASWFRPQMRPRSPLVARFRHMETGAEFHFMVNHLYRGDGVDARRLAQAIAIRDWAAAETIPVVAVGDYNFDWDLDERQSGDNYDKGFGSLTSWSVFHWVVPRNFITTHDSSYNSVLDFVFLANARGIVDARSEIVRFEGEFIPRHRMPDHRPVLADLRFRAN